MSKRIGRLPILTATVLSGALLATSAYAQVSISALNTPVTENFDTLANTGTSSTLPSGWAFNETNSNANGLYTAGTGSASAGDTYSFGANASTERALGTLLSSSLNSTIGASFQNNTGNTLENLTIAYTGEEWRVGTANRADRLDFQISYDATSLTTGTWTDVDALDFNSIQDAATGAKDGNTAGFQSAISSTLTGLSIADGAVFWIRWNEVNASGADDGLAVDDFSISGNVAGDAAPAVDTTTPADTATDVALNSTITINFTESVNATASAFTVECPVASPVAFTSNPVLPASGSSFTLTPNSDLPNNTVCTVTVAAAEITDVDADDPPDNMASDDTFSFTTVDATPQLSIDDISVYEGDSGTSQATFTVTLTNAAAGAFSVDWAVGGGTADAADYDTAASGTLNFTGADAEQHQFSVNINGDTDIETDDTFIATLSNVVGATVTLTDPTGTATIVNDDAANVVQIHDVQGNGWASPMDGQTVKIVGAIVTAVTEVAAVDGSPADVNGFFIQTPDADVDADPLTSEGILVFTGTTAGTEPNVVPGDVVTVVGTVDEYFNLTEITNVTVVRLDGTVPVPGGLPTPVEFSAGSGIPSGDPSALSCPGTGPNTNGDGTDTDTNFECFEGMRVSMPDAVISSANLRRTTDLYAEAFAMPNNKRSRREQGVNYPGPTIAGNAAAGVFDGNPEQIEIDGDEAGLPIGELTAGTTFSAVGVISYSYGDYEFYPTSYSPISTQSVPEAVTASIGGDEMTVASFNMQHMCDDNAADGCSRDTKGTGNANLSYADKLVKVSSYIRTVLNSPDVLGAQEVDSLTTLQDLATQISNDGGPTYSSFLIDGNDVGGIDVGFMVRDDRVSGGSVQQFFLASTWPDPNCNPAPCTDLLHDRPPLLLRAQFDGPNGPYAFAVMNNHTKARSQVDNDTAAAERDRAKRFWQAREIAGLVQDFQTASGAFAGQGTNSIPLILVGDYNAFEYTDGYADVVGLIAGTYDNNANECAAILKDGAGTVETCNLDSGNIVTPALYNSGLAVPADERISYEYAQNYGAVQGSTGRDVPAVQVIDHILLARTAQGFYLNTDYGIANNAAGVETGLTNTGPINSSDHDGMVTYLDFNCVANNTGLNPDGDSVCGMLDNCPNDMNDDQTDANSNNVGAACEAAPVAVNDPTSGSYAATEDTPLNVNAASGVLANDPADPEGDMLSAVKLSDPASGALTLNADGSFDFTPASNTCSTTPLTFTYGASDGEHTSAAATVSILVACVNDAPSITSSAPSGATEDTLYQYTPSASDVDGPSMNWSVAGTDTCGGSFNAGTYEFTPAGPVPPASCTLAIQICDGHPTDELCDTETATITITATDDPAVLADDTASVDEDAAATAIDVLANDVDPDSALLISGLTQPANGTVVVTGGGTSLTYQPDANYCNTGGTTDDFTYDANGQTATVRVTVNCLDDDAVAVDDAATVTQNSSANLIDVLNNDTPDPDFALSIDSVDASSAQGGSVSISGSQVSYTPANGFCGTTDTFSYTLVGGSSATVTVTVDCLPAAIFADGFED